MKNNYCLPIIKKTSKEVLRTININYSKYGYFEVWLDYIGDLSFELLKKLKKKPGKRLILLFRRQNLEPVKLEMEKRLQIIESLKNSSCMLDLDISTQKQEIEYIKAKALKIKLILSYHNYQSTPTESEIEKILNYMSENNATVFKISTFCQSKSDAVRLLQTLLLLKEKKLRHIVLGMGKEGVITRVFGTLWGNEVIFAPMSLKEKSAPGQLTKGELESVFQVLKPLT